jgi:hypothetical protein
MSRTFGRIRQIGHVVRNLDESLDRWRRLGIGPFFRFDHVPLDYFRVGSTDMAIDLSIAVAFSGEMQFELIQQHNPEPSPYKDHLDRYGEGVHHLCSWTNNYDADMERWLAQGYKVALNGQLGGARFSYFRVEFLPDTYMEVADLTLWAGVMQKMQDEAAGWDGRDPVRSMADLVASLT